MSFRVYDKKKKKFIENGILLTPEGELVESKKSFFGNKLSFVDQDRYVYQKYIELDDKDGTPMYIGDYVKAEINEDETVLCMVTFSSQVSAFIIIRLDKDEWFPLGESLCSRVKVVGNVFDDLKKGKKNGDKTN